MGADRVVRVTPVIYNDVLAAVSVVASVVPSRRHAVMVGLIADAERAARYRATHHAAHPVYGDGSLMAAALQYDRHGHISFQTQVGLEAWLCVLSALLERQSQPEAQLMQRRAEGSNSSRLTAMSSPHSSQ
ncbi:hypothetical protein [uncultured Marivita sp.]|uniref:DUF7742 family protein n=1 Tax=uncultured Marivita sp. TaxID=888080 RepID=UPI0026267615|nr:hypothetical protein [uncultured Marivita sp.]